MNAGCRLGTATPGISSKKSSSASPSSIKLLPLARRRRVSSRFLVASNLAGRGAEGRGGRTVGRRGGGTATAAEIDAASPPPSSPLATIYVITHALSDPGAFAPALRAAAADRVGVS